MIPEFKFRPAAEFSFNDQNSPTAPNSPKASASGGLRDAELKNAAFVFCTQRI
jgi:hypothetical protein